MVSAATRSEFSGATLRSRPFPFPRPMRRLRPKKIIRAKKDHREGHMPAITITVNGSARTLDIRDPEKPLLYALRNDLGLKGAKYGCGLGQCGACTVLVDGEPVRSCSVPAASFAGRKITTIEG